MGLTAQQKRDRAARAAALMAELDGDSLKPTQPAKPKQPKAAGRVIDPGHEPMTHGPDMNDEALAAYAKANPTKIERQPTKGFRTDVPPPAAAELVPPNKWPKKYPNPNDIKVGDSVWYRDERYYVDFVPSTWAFTTFIRLCSKHVRPGTPPPRDSHYFYAPADCCDLAPVTKNRFERQPTMADVARKERAKTGVRDVGDPVAEKLREATSQDELYRIASEFLGVPEIELRDRYAHLNPGQQRMNLGNRMRSKWKKENKQ